MSVFEKHPKLTITVVLLIFTAVADLVLTRTYVRRAKDAKQNREQCLRMPSDVYHHDLRPNASCDGLTWGSREFSTSTNSLGFKDEQPREVPLLLSTPRTVVIGDSFTEGMGYEYSKTWAGLVAAAWKKQGRELLNAGVASYCPTIYYSKVRYLIEAKKLQFDELVVFLDISDIKEETTYELGNDGRVTEKAVEIKTEKAVEVKEELPTMRNRIGTFIVDNSTLIPGLLTLTNLILATVQVPQKHFRDRMHVRASQSLWTGEDAAFEAYGKAGRELATRHLEQLHDLLTAHHIGMKLVIYPWPYQLLFDRTAERHTVHWKEWADRNGVPFISLYPLFMNLGDPEAVLNKYFIANDVHWNEAGNALVAAEFLRQYAALTPPAAPAP